MERAEEMGWIEPSGESLVCGKPDGSWIHPHSFSQILDRKVAKLDVPTISLHDLRHTHATLLLKAGIPVKVVSERLGHANVAFTMSVYQHVLPGMQAEADRKSVVSGQSVSVRVDLGGRRYIKQKTITPNEI